MKKPVRLVQATLAFGLALAGFAAPAAAEDWPTRPISLVIPFGPGSGTDLVARIISGPVGDFYYWMGLFFPKNTPAPPAPIS